MVCIEKIYSVSALVGDGSCNGNCSFCSGAYLRSQAKPSLQNDKNLESAIKLSARYGGWSLSLTSSGEPTCDPDAVTHALEIYKKCADQGAYFANVNLFTNGILIGNQLFCRKYLPVWRALGLTNIAVSVHDVSEQGQAKIYGKDAYPDLAQIARNIEEHGLGARATLLLRRGGVDDAKKYEHAIKTLIGKGFHNITSWPIGKPDGSKTQDTPTWWSLFQIRWWLLRNARFSHGHVWGGGVYEYEGNLVRLTDYVTRHDPKKDYVRQLVVFQDDTVSYSWIREGALCMR